MSLTRCKECNHEISDKAYTCPNCGLPLRSLGYEYRSKATLLGLPLVHIAMGGGRPGVYRRGVARGIIAIGDVAIGVFAVGGVALGGITFGGLSLGLIALGGLAIGIGLALGGGAIGLIAIGGGALGYYAMGGGAFGVHVLDAARQDPEAVELFSRFLGDWIAEAVKK